MWIANREMKKDTIGILRRVYLWKHHCPLFSFSFLFIYLFIFWLWKQVLVLTESMAPGGYQISHSAAEEYAQCPHADSCWTPMHYGFTGILFSWTIPNAVAICGRGIKEWWTPYCIYIIHICCAYTQASLSHRTSLITQTQRAAGKP